MFCKPDILVYPSPAADGYWTYILQPSCIANSHWFNDQTRIKYKINNYIPYRLFNCSVRGTNLSINLPTVLGYDISLRTGKKLQQSWSGYTFLHCAWRLVRLKIPKVRICRFFFFTYISLPCFSQQLAYFRHLTIYSRTSVLSLSIYFPFSAFFIYFFLSTENTVLKFEIYENLCKLAEATSISRPIVVLNLYPAGQNWRHVKCRIEHHKLN